MLRLIGRMIDRTLHGRWNTGGYFYGDSHLVSAGASLAERWNDIAEVADFRPTDRVLDMGCAEGLISFEVAKRAAHVDGVDIDANRIERAKSGAAKRGVKNVSFFQGSVVDFALDPAGYDVILFLSVMAPRNSDRVGMREFIRLLRAARRQIVVRINVQQSTREETLLGSMLGAMEDEGFDGVCFLARRKSHGNLVIGNRRGTDARLNKIPPIALVPTDRLYIS